MSNVPAQSLILMNDPSSSPKLGLVRADRKKSAGEARVGNCTWKPWAGNRPPASLDEALRFVAVQEEQYRKQDAPSAAAALAWGDLCHVMFNLKEFIFIE